MPLQLYKIATVEVGSAGASSIAFSSIPQGYTDLKVVISARSNYAGITEGVTFNFNSDTSGGYSYRYLQGDGASVSSASVASGTYIQAGLQNGANNTANVFGNMEIYIPNYTVAQYKSISADSVGENNTTTSYQRLLAGLYSSNTAISSIQMIPSLGTSWSQYTTAILYGIL
jgi:hypothetical protein